MMNICSPRLWLIVLISLFAGCEKKPLTALEQVQCEGVLHVITRNSPSTYFEGRNDKTGFEYELSKRFADKLGVKLQIETVDSLDALYERLDRTDKPLLAAAGLVETEQREQQAMFSNPYFQVTSQVIYRKNETCPASIKDLIGKSILVIKGSSQANRLKLLKEKWPDLNYQESDSVDIVDLLQSVMDKKVDIALLNSNELAMVQVYYPDIRVAFDLPGPQKLVWAMGKQMDGSLIDVVNHFFDESVGDKSLPWLLNRFYGHIDVLGYVGAYSFAKHLQDRLPRYEPYFVRYGREYKVDWRLLAAIGYQESHWNPEEKSPTGVRGLMMLTQSTAKQMGVSNRLDAKQSIMGGAKLLVFLIRGVDKQVTSVDRLYFALAAYNMGQGHVSDAQKIAMLQGLDGKQWRHVDQVLPLLSQKIWFAKTRYGYARGLEAKQFVRNVRRYYDILSWLDNSQRELPVNTPKDLHIPAIGYQEAVKEVSYIL